MSSENGAIILLVLLTLTSLTDQYLFIITFAKKDIL